MQSQSAVQSRTKTCWPAAMEFTGYVQQSDLLQ